jgi:hypothetical protein
LPIVLFALAAGLALPPVPAARAQDSSATPGETASANPAPGVVVPQVAGPGLPTLSDSDGNIAQRIITGSQATRCRPGRAADGAIVVCRDAESREKERLPLRDQTDTAQSTDDGLPRAPNVSGLRPCLGKHTCMGFGSVPPPMYYFDIAALPPPPEGSDADRIAKGEIRAP